MFVLFDINDTPNSPFGDSTAWYVQLEVILSPSLQFLKCFIKFSILL